MENKTINKRNRSSNWSESEKALLTQIIKEKIHLIENKDVSKNNNQLKKTAWQEVLQSFNEMNDTMRDLPQLMNQWRNTKNNIKKRNFEYRRNRNATGGGPPPPSPPPEDVEIMEIIPNEFDTDHNFFDSDSLVTKNHVVKEENIIVINTPECSSSLPPTQMVQTPNVKLSGEARVPKKLFINKTKKRARVSLETNKSEEIYLLAKSAREQQMQFQQKEHELRMKMMEEEHKRRLQILEKELEYWEKKLEK